MDAEMIKNAVKDAMDEKMAAYWVDRETHYQHHKFIDAMIKWTEMFKSTTMKAVVNFIVGGILFAIVVGFAVWRGGKG